MRRILRTLNLLVAACFLLAMTLPSDGTHFTFLTRYFAVQPFDACQNSIITESPGPISLNIALAAVGSTPTTIAINCALPITGGGTLTVPSTAGLSFSAHGSLAAASPVTLVVKGAFTAPDVAIFPGTVTPQLQQMSQIRMSWFGTVGDGVTTGNSPRIQAAVNAARLSATFNPAGLGGGSVYALRGTYLMDAPVIVPAGVSLKGEDRSATIFKKTTATPSSVSDNTVRFWDSATVGNPICVFHFVEGASTGWSYGTVSDITVLGDTTDPNTSVVDYGFFFRGVSNGTVQNNLARYVKVGYFFGAASNILFTMRNNIAADVQRGFYVHFMTSSIYQTNYVSKFRFAGHYLSAYYSDISGNAADNGGFAAYRLANTEVALAYEFHSCIGADIHSNGAESHNGPVWKLESNISSFFHHNLALNVTSNHDNVASGLNIYALDIASASIDMVYEENKIVFGVPKLSGAAIAGSHFNWHTVGELGIYTWSNNHFVDTLGGVGESGWVNTSGVLVDKAGQEGSFVATATGMTATITHTVVWSKNGNVVTVNIPEFRGTSNAITFTVTGMPAALFPVRQQWFPVFVSDNGNPSNIGALYVETNGIWTLYYGPAQSGWTASGQKILFTATLTYLLQ